MGWSSWNAFRVDISEDIIKHQADLMVEKGLKDAGYHYINVDDGFFGKRDDNGIMFTNEKRFPNGMKPVADHIHSLGMKAGIYLRDIAQLKGTLQRLNNYFGGRQYREVFEENRALITELKKILSR